MSKQVRKPVAASPQTDTHSFGALFAIRPFRNLWVAQLLSQTAHNGIHYVELLMIARLTDSTGHVGLMILAFTLPAVLFSAVAGVVVDRFPKRQVLVSSNALRVLLALSYLVALTFLNGTPLIAWVYIATFMTSAIAQFFAPAEGATIPLLVGRRRLITANSLFNLTITGTQVMGLLVLFPVIIKLGDSWLGQGHGIELSFALVALMYSIAVLLLRTLPPDPVLARVTTTASESAGALQRGWEDMRAGLSFVRHTPTLWVPMINLSLTATIAYILAMVAPKYASDILQVSQEDAIYIFAPAGIGMLVGTFVIPRVGSAFRRETISNSGLALQAVMLSAMALVAEGLMGQPTTLTIATMALAFSIGLGFAMIGIPAQTMLQERTPHQMRGRVFAAQYLLANSLAIAPMLVAGTIADRVGIPPVVLSTGLFMILVSLWSFFWASRHKHTAPPTV